MTVSNDTRLISDDFTPDGYIYILRGEDYYKIGRTKYPSDRIKRLAIQLPFPVSVMHVFPSANCALTERVLHQKLKGRRCNGEWFRLTPRDIRILESVRYASGPFAYIDNIEEILA